jgi:hypothetical protein
LILSTLRVLETIIALQYTMSEQSSSSKLMGRRASSRTTEGTRAPEEMRKGRYSETEGEKNERRKKRRPENPFPG